MKHQYRLTYFSARGAAEYIRFLLKYSKIDFDDVRYVWGSDEWTKVKENQPFGKLPVLEIDGVVIAESRAIARYIARENGLAGKNNIESAKCDMIASSLRDFIEHRWKWLLETDSEKKEELRKVLIDQECPNYLGALIKLMKNDDYLVGNALTWADVIVAQNLWELRNDFPHLFDNYKALSGLIDKVHNLPGIKEWVAERPVTEY